MVNIFEKLKDCPKGTKLYSPIFGDVTLYKLQEVIDKGSYTILVKTLKDSIFSFNSFGQHYDYSDSECMLFPSKENRDWNTFSPFKDGDILYVKTFSNKYIFINKNSDDKEEYATYCYYCYLGVVTRKNLNYLFPVSNIMEIRYATDEEKQNFFDALKRKGYKWNSETKTLENLITPTFKVGDKITNKKDKQGWVKIATITDTCYIDEHRAFNIPIEKQDEWELYVDKFDPATLIPFDSKVLVRELGGMWKPAIFAGYNSQNKNYYTVGAISWLRCIPYEENKHLLFTYEDCDDYYKN